jgi:ribosomal protein S18 acetylase RimI-like enzyme
MKVELREARAGDLETLVAFNLALAEETEGKRLDPATLRRGVAAVLADASKGFYLVAERGGRVLGQLMVTREWSDWRDGDWWWFQSVYVAPEARRQGVFQALYAEIVARSQAAGARGLRLYVENENRGAQATYELGEE